MRIGITPVSVEWGAGYDRAFQSWAVTDGQSSGLPLWPGAQTVTPPRRKVKCAATMPRNSQTVDVA